MLKATTELTRRRSVWRDGASWELLILCLPALAGYIFFHYVPLAMSIVIPFKSYKFSKGIFGSAWCGLDNFKWLLASDSLGQVIGNTVSWSLWFLALCPVVNIAFALLLFEVRKRWALKIYQTCMTLPNFMSFVIIGYITYAILSPSMGVMNQLRVFLGMDAIDVYRYSKYWRVILTLVNLWSGVGMGSMMYFASLMGIDVSLFEAAKIDGANRWQQTKYISLPHLIPLACIFTILGIGGIFGGSFDLFYVIPRNVAVLYDVTDILPTYIYRALKNGQYSMGATTGFFQSVTGLFLVVAANLVVRKISPENSLF